jgi:hypothetical protein
MAHDQPMPAWERAPSAVTALRPRVAAWLVKRRRRLSDSVVDGVGTAEVGAIGRARLQGRKLTVDAGRQ